VELLKPYAAEDRCSNWFQNENSLQYSGANLIVKRVTMVVKNDSKYFPLNQFLSRSSKKRVRLSFTEIEKILDAPLPESAKRGRSFWSNRARGGVQAAAWLEAGFRVADVDLIGRVVVFRRPILRYSVRREGNEIRWDAGMVRAFRAYLGVNQAEMAEMLGVRQQTVSEWETAAYTPTRSRSKYLTLVAEQRGFYLGGGEQEISAQSILDIDKDDETV
jgi:predicted DNA-binding protein (UPF0251 family)